jgi:hypothetical protein
LCHGDREWYVNGKLHRDGDQPTIICGDVDREWYLTLSGRQQLQMCNSKHYPPLVINNVTVRAKRRKRQFFEGTVSFCVHPLEKIGQHVKTPLPIEPRGSSIMLVVETPRRDLEKPKAKTDDDDLGGFELVRSSNG